MNIDRQLPQALEAERAVLGGLMLTSGLATELAAHVQAADFYRPDHGRLFQLLLDLEARGEPTELAAVCERLVREGTADQYGGLSYVSGLPDSLPSTANLDYYAALVRDRAQRRRLVFAAQEIAERVLVGAEEWPDLLCAAEGLLQPLTQAPEIATWHPASEIATEVYHLAKVAADQGQPPGVSSGYLDLDRMLGALAPSDLVILAARPAMGKTALAMSIAANVARGGHAVGVFSLEMGRQQLGARLLSGEARVGLSALRQGRLHPPNWVDLARAHDTVAGLPLHVDDTPALNVAQIRTRAKRLKAQRPDLALLVVDYIGLMGGDPRISREQQVSASSRGLKAVAKELDVCVLGLSQLNRGVEQRTDKRPLLSDLRDSGAIEQDADSVLFIYRDEYYNRDSADKNIAEVIVAKQRNGPTGTARLFFDGEYTRFENLDESGRYL